MYTTEPIEDPGESSPSFMWAGETKPTSPDTIGKIVGLRRSDDLHIVYEPLPYAWFTALKTATEIEEEKELSGNSIVSGHSATGLMWSALDPTHLTIGDETETYARNLTKLTTKSAILTGMRLAVSTQHTGLEVSRKILLGAIITSHKNYKQKTTSTTIEQFEKYNIGGISAKDSYAKYCDVKIDEIKNAILKADTQCKPYRFPDRKTNARYLD